MDTITRVQLPEAGPGVELYVENVDWRKLYGEMGKDYVSILDQGIASLDFETMDKFLSVAAKKNGAPHPIKVEQVLLPPTEIRKRLHDAFALSLSGLDYRSYVKKTVSENRQLMDDIADPQPQGPEASSRL